MNVEKLISDALTEDMPTGDVTTDNLPLVNRSGYARLVAKQDLTLSGRELFEKTFLNLNASVHLDWHFKDGDHPIKGQTLVVMKGPLAVLLKGERTALNFLGHLSGIATFTQKFVLEVEHTRTKILDTRKTIPGYRELQKKAVRDGGGHNHRMDLSSAVLIKENHIRAVGSMAGAVEAIRATHNGPIEVETSTFEEVKEAVSLKVQRILLDNMSNDLLARVLSAIPPGIESEASGNMSLDRVRSVAELGVSFISVGAITHSAPCADMSLLFDWTRS